MRRPSAAGSSGVASLADGTTVVSGPVAWALSRALERGDVGAYSPLIRDVRRRLRQAAADAEAEESRQTRQGETAAPQGMSPTKRHKLDDRASSCELWLSTKEAAQLHGCTPRTIQRLIGQDALVWRQRGRRFEVHRASLEALAALEVIDKASE